MTTYTILPRPDGTGFDAGGGGVNGAPQTMIGFATAAEADEWIASDKARHVTAGRPEP